MYLTTDNATLIETQPTGVVIRGREIVIALWNQERTDGDLDWGVGFADENRVSLITSSERSARATVQERVQAWQKRGGDGTAVAS